MGATFAKSRYIYAIRGFKHPDFLRRAINPVILSAAEACRKLKEKDHFISSVQRAEKLFLIGEEYELAKAFN